VLHNIRHNAPTPIEELAPHVPDALPAIVERCLAKSPGDRYHSMRDLALDLRVVAQRLSAPSKPATHGGSAALPRRRAPAWWRWVAGAALLAIVIASASVVFMRRKPASLGTPVMRALVRWPSYESQCRFSPDGAWVSFISDRTRQRSIWLRRTSGG